MPIYNTAAYLPRCIESIVNQTYNDLQIILVNDGSTDNSGAIAEEWRAKDTRIEVYHQANQGQSVARNTGLDHAKGEYISFVDADDYIDHDYIATMLQAADETTDCVQIGYRRIRLDGKRIKVCTPAHFYQYTVPWARLYRRDFIETHALRFPKGMIYEDVVFSIDLWRAHPTYKLLPYHGYNYVQHNTSTTSIRHQQAEKELYKVLQLRTKNITNIKEWLIIQYTIVRLKIHFIL